MLDRTNSLDCDGSKHGIDRSKAASRPARRSAKCLLLVLTFPFMLAGVAIAGEATGAGAGAEIADAGSAMQITIGDTVKLSFYELLDSEDAKWRGPNGRSLTAPREFHERNELSGQYIVQDDGSINIPLIGTFNAAEKDRSALAGAILPSFEQLIGRKGYVNVLSVERQPIYVLGPVQKPGTFKYEPGLTALHAVALAGGMRRTDTEGWQNIESRREFVTLQKSVEKVKRLIARTVVLQAERGDTQSGMKELVGLAGQQDSTLLMNLESSQSQMTQLERAVQSAALATAINNYRSELAVRSDRIAPFEDAIRLRTERMKGLQQLVDKNLATRASLIQAQSELSEVQDRRQQAIIDVEATRQKLQQSQQDLAKHNLETRLEIEKAVATAERDSADAVATTEGSLNVLQTFGALQAAASGEAPVSFEIVRRDVQGVKVIQVSETTLLRPGDLLKVQSHSTASR